MVFLLNFSFLSETYTDLIIGLSTNQEGGTKMITHASLAVLKGGGGGKPASVKNVFDKAVKIINYIKL